MIPECRCRYCNKQYAENKSTCEMRGYCSQKCMHANAKRLGYKKNGLRSEYEVLKSYNAVGSVPTPSV